MSYIEHFRLTKRQYYMDFFITPPLTVLLACHSLFVNGLSLYWLGEFLLGAFIWTFYEYALHRWVLHGIPLARRIHALHHFNQLEYIAQPPWATLLTYILLFAVFGARSSAFALGFSTGYIVYAVLHTVFHYMRFTKDSWLWKLDQRHVYHHRFDDSCYGVTTSLWDRLFRTETTRKTW